MSSTTKSDIDRRVAFEEDIPFRTVRKVTAAFLEQLSEELARFGHVRLPGFGQFYVSKLPSAPYTRLTDGKKMHVARYQVYFRKGRKLKTALEQEE